MKLILHPGLHKTGTSSLQRYLNVNREKLLGYGLLYPVTGLFGDQHALIPGSLISGHPFLPEPEQTIDELLSQLKEEVQSSPAHTCILSSEVFSELFFGREELLLKLIVLFDSVSVFLTTRDINAIAISSLKHMARVGSGDQGVMADTPYSCIDRFAGHKFSIERDLDDWLRISQMYHLQLHSASLEDSGGHLIKHYLSQMSIAISEQDFSSLLADCKEDEYLMINADEALFSALDYFLLFLAGIVGCCSDIRPSFDLMAVKSYLCALPPGILDGTQEKIDTSLMTKFFLSATSSLADPISIATVHSFLLQSGLDDDDAELLLSVATAFLENQIQSPSELLAEADVNS